MSDQPDDPLATLRGRGPFETILFRGHALLVMDRERYLIHPDLLIVALDRALEADAKIAALKERVAVLEARLKPWVDAWDSFKGSDWRDAKDDSPLPICCVRVRDYRAAAQALED